MQKEDIAIDIDAQCYFQEKEDKFLEFLGKNPNKINQDNSEFLFNIASSFYHHEKSYMNFSILNESKINKTIEKFNFLQPEKKIVNTEIFLQNESHFLAENIPLSNVAFPDDISKIKKAKTKTKIKKMTKNTGKIRANSSERQILRELVNEIKENDKDNDINKNQAKVIQEVVSDKKEDPKREEKLLRNKMSAKKCREKKKKYIENLEKIVQDYQNEINSRKNNYYFSFDYHISELDKKEKEFIQPSLDNKEISSNKVQYIENQKTLLSNMINKQIKLMMPIDCKLFEKKFIKLNQIEDEDNIDIIFNKAQSNIDLLNELYDFSIKETKEISIKGKEGIAYKLFKYYSNLIDLLNIFKVSLNLI